MPLVAIGAVTIRHWIWGPEFAWRTRRSLRQARVDGDCLHAEVFPKNGLLFSMTQWRDGAAMKRYATSGAHARVIKVARRISDPLHFAHVWRDTIPSHEEAFALWKAAAPEVGRA